MVFLRMYAMFYNILYYVPFVRNKALVKKRIRKGDKSTLENVRCVVLFLGPTLLQIGGHTRTHLRPTPARVSIPNRKMPSTWSTYGELNFGSEQGDDAWSIDTEFHRNPLARVREPSNQTALVPEIRQGDQPAFQPTFFNADKFAPIDLQHPPVNVAGHRNAEHAGGKGTS